MMATASRRYHVGEVHDTVKSARNNRCDELSLSSARPPRVLRTSFEKTDALIAHKLHLCLGEKRESRKVFSQRLSTHIAQERPEDRGGCAREDEEQQDQLDV